MTGRASEWPGLVVTELGAVDLVAVRLGGSDRHGSDRHGSGSWRVLGRGASHALVRLVHADLDRADCRGCPPAVDLDALIRLAENLTGPRGHPDE